jgi:predicted nucleic acid-binding protein
MTVTTDVFFDTWAWLEILHETTKGIQLRRRYLGEGRRVHASPLSLAEISARLSVQSAEDKIEATLALIERQAHMCPIATAVARAAGPLRTKMRRRHPKASLVDALILASARHLGVPLISGDEDFEGEADVRVS